MPRWKINYNDPAFLNAENLTRNRNAAIPHAHKSVRGLYSNFTRQQANKLQQMDAFGRRQKSAERMHKKDLAESARQFNASMGLERKRLSEAKKGAMWAMPLQIGTAALGIMNNREDRLFREAMRKKMLNDELTTSLYTGLYDFPIK